jgi:hypothetical protein
MQIDANHSLRRGTFHEPVLDLKNTMATLHAFSEAEARSDDSDAFYHGMTVCAS